MASCAGAASVGGNLPGNSKEFADYLTRLVGRGVAPDELLQLSSGQQARVAGWLAEHGISVANMRVRLGAPFTAVALLDGNVTSVGQLPAKPVFLSGQAGVGGNLCIGIDIQRIDELIPDNLGHDLKSSSELNAMFTTREISYAQSRAAPLESLGGLFAAKEALRKCDAALLSLPLNELEILPDDSGRPNYPGYALSISHSGGFAIAVAASIPKTESIPPSRVIAASQAQPPIQPHALTVSRSSVRTFLISLILAVGACGFGLLCLEWLGIFRFHN
jgi:phosphopantetheinyl transferase (holo-ACP synthase)